MGPFIILWDIRLKLSLVCDCSASCQAIRSSSYRWKIATLFIHIHEGYESHASHSGWPCLSLSLLHLWESKWPRRLVPVAAGLGCYQLMWWVLVGSYSVNRTHLSDPFSKNALVDSWAHNLFYQKRWTGHYLADPWVAYAGSASDSPLWRTCFGSNENIFPKKISYTLE